MYVDQICLELSFVSVYIDDILDIQEDNVHHLQILFTSLSQYGLVINPIKRKFGAPPSMSSATALALQFSSRCTSSSKVRALLGSGKPTCQAAFIKKRRDSTDTYSFGLPRSFSTYINHRWSLECCYCNVLGTPSVGCGHKVVLSEDMSYGWHVLRDDILMGWHLLQKNCSHGRTYLTGDHVLWEDECYWRTCLMGG